MLHETVKKLSEEQRRDVEEIGLGSLLDMTIDGIPSALGYYVVDRFDPTTNRIKMKTRFLDVSSESIHKIRQIRNKYIRAINNSRFGEDITNT